MSAVINRILTKLFIEQDPTVITLIPVEMVDMASGGTKPVDKTPRAPQIFKMIWQGGNSTGINTTADGQNRQFDFIMVGEYDAEVEIGDHWTDGSQEYYVDGLEPFNGYEIKAHVKSFGEWP